MAVRAGDFFTGPYPPGSGKKRRFIVVTDEIGGECTVVWVYASTTASDFTVTLGRGIHPEITQDCTIVYEQASIVETATITAALNAGALVRSTPLGQGVLREVQSGIYLSEETPIEVMDYCDGRF